MKAFASFPVALLFVLTLAVLAAVQNNLSSHSVQTSTELLSLEKKHYADVSLKKAFFQVLSLSKGSDEKEISENTAQNLARLEDFSRGYFQKQEVQVELWFGEFDESQEKAVLQQTLENKRPVACSHCYSFKTMTVDWDKKPVFKSVELIFDRKISKAGLVHSPSSAEWVGRNIAFGATFYSSEEGIAWISVMKEGFG